jgi:hypothetical protein
MDQRGKTRTGKKKKIPPGGMDVCVVFVVQELVWIIGDMKKGGRFKSTKWIKGT